MLVGDVAREFGHANDAATQQRQKRRRVTWGVDGRVRGRESGKVRGEGRKKERRMERAGGRRRRRRNVVKLGIAAKGMMKGGWERWSED